MNIALQTVRGAGRSTKVLIAIGAVLVLLALLLVFFPWDLLRGPLNRYVSEQTGRRFEITRRLDVKLGRTTRVFADGIEFANPSWAAEPYLLKAESAELHLRLWPLLLKRQVELPFLGLRGPQFGLQMEADGRRTWALDKTSSDEGSVPSIGRIQVDRGSLHFLSTPQQADIRAEFSLKEGAGEALPLAYQAKGSWKKQPFTAEGRTGSVLQIGSKTEAQQDPFPLEIRAVAGRTRLEAAGTVGNLAQLDGIDARVDLRGTTLADLHTLLGVVLPGTPPYALKGQLRKQGEVWSVQQMQGKLGESDLGGELAYHRGEPVPRLSGKLESKRLDFEDLGPLIGLQTDKQKAGVDPTPPAVLAANRRMRRSGNEKLLPVKKLDFSKLKEMNADVWYTAASVRNMQALPVTQLKVHVQLSGGALKLDPLEMGMAGGRATGRIHVDSSTRPATALVQMDGRSLQINRLFPAVERLQASFGSLNARVDLRGRGDSISTLLGSSSGSLGLLTGRGQFSNILLEFLGLDGGEVIRLFVRGDRQVQLRCAAAAFEVKQGALEARTLLLDTADTVVHGSGGASFADESISLVLRPEPKDMSILSVRTPLRIGGTFAQPKVRPEGGSLAARAALALGLAAINPLLALGATIETGPGQDADCAQSFREASAVAKTGSPTKPAPAPAR